MATTQATSRIEQSNHVGGRTFDVAIRSLKNFKGTPQYRVDLRRAIEQANLDAVQGRTAQERQRAKFTAVDYQVELDCLLAGAEPDAFQGLVCFETPEAV